MTRSHQLYICRKRRLEEHIPDSGCILSNTPRFCNRSYRAIPAILLSVLLAYLGIPDASSAQAKELELKLAYPGPPDGIWERLAKTLTIRSATVKSFPVQLLGGARRSLSLLKQGRVNVVPVDGIRLAWDIKEFNLLNLPFLLTNIKQAREVVQSNEVKKYLKDAAANSTLQILGYTWEVGTFVSRHRCVKTFKDIPGARVINLSPLYKSLLKKWDAKPLNIPFGQAWESMLHGRADYGLFPVEFIMKAGISQVSRCLTDPSSNAAILRPFVIMSTIEWWNRLSERERKDLATALKNLESQADKEMARAVEDTVKNFKASNRSTTLLNRAEVKAWQKKAETLYQSFREHVPNSNSALDKALGISP